MAGKNTHNPNLRPPKPAGHFVTQSAAICHRMTEAGRQILLITSRDTGRWVLPKGGIEKGEKPRQAAAREASEEAGVEGSVSKQPFGYYPCSKRKHDAGLVSVFLLEVSQTRRDFLEADVRNLKWISPADAAHLVNEPELSELLAKFSETDLA